MLHNACRDVIIRKKMHAYLKIIRKAVKKAKLFEIRKIGRRLKLAQEGTSKANADTDTEKLESQLNAARQADVEALAKKAAGSLPDLPDGIIQVTNSEISESPAEEIVYRHILGSKCVLDQLATISSVIQTAVQKIDKIRKSIELSTNKEDSNLQEDDRKDATESEELREPDDVAQNALQKLLNKQSERRAHEMLSDTDDSGLLEYDSFRDSLDSDDSEKEDPSDSDADEEELPITKKNKKDESSKKTETQIDKNKNNPALTNEKKGKKKVDAKQKKPKNRLGQRARRKLAEQMHGKQAKHLTTTPEENGGDSAAGGRQRKSAYKSHQTVDIYPSWAAKKQQKTKLAIDSDVWTARKSQKILFDDENGEKRADSHFKQAAKGDSSLLHPSWALKKQQQEKHHLVPSQGKKVVFNEDSD